MYARESSDATNSALTPLLRRKQNGRRILQKQHFTMLGLLWAVLEGGEGMLSRAELEAWFAEEDSHPKSVARVLADLRTAGLIAYESDRKTRSVKVRMASPHQPVLALDGDDLQNPGPDPGFPKLSNIGNPNLESRKSKSSPPHTPPCKESPPETCIESSRVSARGRGCPMGDAATPTEPDWQGARRLRQATLGEAFLTDGEASALRRLHALGGRTRDLSEAVAWWRRAAAEGQAPKEVRSFGYFVRIAARSLEARQGKAPPRSMPKPAPVIRIAAPMSVEERAARLDAKMRAEGYVSIAEARR